MRELEGGSEVNEAAISTFREILGRIPTQEAHFFRDLLDRGLVRLTTDEYACSVMKKNRGRGIGMCVCFTPQSRSAKTLVSIDSDLFISRGTRSSEGLVRDMLEMFGNYTRTVDKLGFDWQYLEDSEVRTFLDELEHGESERYRVFDVSQRP